MNVRIVPWTCGQKSFDDQSRKCRVMSFHWSDICQRKWCIVHRLLMLLSKGCLSSDTVEKLWIQNSTWASKHIGVLSNNLHLQAATILARPIPIQQRKSPCKHTSNWIEVRRASPLHIWSVRQRQVHSTCRLGVVVTNRHRMDGVAEHSTVPDV